MQILTRFNEVSCRDTVQPGVMPDTLDAVHLYVTQRINATLELLEILGILGQGSRTRAPPSKSADHCVADDQAVVDRSLDSVEQ